MADKKKVFSITINGIKESTDAVKALNDQLKETEGIIDRLKNAKVEVKVSAGDTKTPKVSGNSKVESDVEKEKTKQLELQNEALRQQFIERERLKEQNKEALHDIKAEAKGYVEIQDGVKVYANTLNGMRKQLHDLIKEHDNIDKDTEKWRDMADEIYLLTENVKQLEAQQNKFYKNVGNYYNSVMQAILDARDTQQEFLEIQYEGTPLFSSLNDMKAKLNGLTDAWKNMSPNDVNFDKTTEAIRILKDEIKKMEDSLKDAGDEANRFGEQFSVTLEGVEYKFNDVGEAIQKMTKRLIDMRVSGQENTSTYKELVAIVARLKDGMGEAKEEIEGVTSSTKGIRSVVSIFKGLSGVASLGQGIAGLFGGSSEELDKLIQKFASLTLISSGLKSLQEEMNEGSTAFGKFAQKFNGWMDSMLNGINKVKDASKNIIDFNKLNKELGDMADYINKTSDAFVNMQLLTGGADEFQNLTNILTEYNGKLNDLDDEGLQKVNDAVQQLKDAFPSLSDEIDNFMDLTKKDDDVQNRLTDTYNRYQQTLSTLSPMQLKIANGLSKLGVAGKVATKAVYGVTVALKALGKAFLIGFALEALSLAIEGVTKALEWLYDALNIGKLVDWVSDSFLHLFDILSDNDVDKLTAQLDRLKNRLDSLNENVDIQIKLGNMGEVEGQLTKLENRLSVLAKTSKTVFGQKQIAAWINEMKEVKLAEQDLSDLNEMEKKVALGLERLTYITPEFLNSLKDKSPEEAMTALNIQLQNIGLSAESLNLITTFLSKGDDTIEEFLKKLSHIDSDLNDIGKDGIKLFGALAEEIKKAGNEAADAAGKVKSLLERLQDQEYTLRLKLNADDVEAKKAQFDREWEEAAREAGLTLEEVINGTGRAATEAMRGIAEQLRRNYELAQKIFNKELKDAQDKKAKDALKKQRAEENARLELLKEGLDKEIAILEQKRKEELQDAAETGKSRETINAIYDKRILEATKKYEDERTKIIEDNNKRIRDIEAKHKQEMLDMRRSNEDTNTDTAMGSNENQNITVKRNITYDTTTTGNDNVNAQKDYYEKLLAEETRYINEKEQLEAEAAQREHQRQIEDEVARFNSLRESNAQELEERKKALDEMVEQGKITQEEANEMLDKLNEAHMSTEAEQQRQHLENLAAIKKHGEEVITNIHKQAEDERQQATMEALNNMMAATQDFYNDIDKVMERAQKRKTNSAGFIDYGAYRKSIKDALDATKQAAQQIEAEKKRLQDALNSKQISFDDFSKAMKQLNQFAEDVKDKAKELQRTLASSFNTWLGNMMNNINQYTSVLSGMFDTINEMYTRELDQQAEALEKKQEMYDEELEMLEEQLTKQEELTEQHKDKINSTEDELKTARGDRRQALIESLAAEKKAAEESMKQERKLTEEKKKNAQKQEQLKKEQEIIEKKRKQQEKRAAIVQATINMFTSISNALAIQPWFLGVALAAVAASLGTANIASIASQQYADGGLLHGPSHKAGGMRIQGTNLEVEGGEMVVNKATTAQNLPLLEYINSNRRRLTKQDLINFYDNGKTSLINKSVQTKFAEGGRLPQLNVNVKDLVKNITRVQDDRPIVVSVVDIVNATDDLRTVQTLAGVDND